MNLQEALDTLRTGDLVETLWDDGQSYKAEVKGLVYVGNDGSIAIGDAHGDIQDRLRDDGYTRPCLTYVRVLEPAQPSRPEPKFKVGDKVFHTPPYATSDFSDWVITDEPTWRNTTYLDPGWRYRCKGRVNSGEIDVVSLYEPYLTLATPDNLIPTLRDGDRIRFTLAGSPQNGSIEATVWTTGESTMMAAGWMLYPGRLSELEIVSRKRP